KPVVTASPHARITHLHHTKGETTMARGIDKPLLGKLVGARFRPARMIWTRRPAREVAGGSAMKPRMRGIRVVLLLLVSASAALALAPQVLAGTGALRWHGYMETDVGFSSFFDGNSTLMARFMPQYTRAYRGPILGSAPRRCICSAGTTFELGMGDYQE